VIFTCTGSPLLAPAADVTTVFYRRRRKLARPLRIVEVCASIIRTTSCALKKGWRGMMPVTIETGFDLLTVSGGDKGRKHLVDNDPGVIVAGRPCDPSALMIPRAHQRSAEAIQLTARKAVRTNGMSGVPMCIIIWRVSPAESLFLALALAWSRWSWPWYLSWSWAVVLVLARLWKHGRPPAESASHPPLLWRDPSVPLHSL